MTHFCAVESPPFSHKTIWLGLFVQFSFTILQDATYDWSQKHIEKNIAAETSFRLVLSVWAGERFARDWGSAMALEAFDVWFQPGADSAVDCSRYRPSAWRIFQQWPATIFGRSVIFFWAVTDFSHFRPLCSCSPNLILILPYFFDTSSTAQGSGGSFQDRQPEEKRCWLRCTEDWAIH